jgi:hypothetical protein
LRFRQLQPVNYLPSILKARHRVDQVPYAVIMEGYVYGFLKHKVDAFSRLS